MTKDVLICISGLHMENGLEDEIEDGIESGIESGIEENDQEENGPIEVVVPGSYFFRNGKNYLIFEEHVEGFQDPIKSQIKWQGCDCVEVSKKGITNMNMIYEKNKKTQCFYNTPYGQLDLGIFTSDIIVDESEENIDVYVEYMMEANHQLLAECKISINVKPQGSKDFSLL